MASDRWSYQIVEIKPRLFGKTAELIQAELNRVGAQGWELVTVTQLNYAHPIRLFLKKSP